MMKLNKEELLEYLRENLRITTERKYGMYSSEPPTQYIMLELDGEVISETSFDIDWKGE